MEMVGFGGGCHWCTEAVFQSLRGVMRVEQGFLKSTPPADTWSEAVIVHFDPNLIDLETLIEVHVRTHSSTGNHSMRSKYRSAVYVYGPEQGQHAERILQKLQPEFDGTLVTRVLPSTDFKVSDVRFQNYYRTNPDRAFCKRYIDPKLQLIRERFKVPVNA